MKSEKDNVDKDENKNLEMRIPLDMIKCFDAYIFKRLTFKDYIDNSTELRHWILDQNFSETNSQIIFNYINALEGEELRDRKNPELIIQLRINILLAWKDYELESFSNVTKIINQCYYNR